MNNIIINNNDNNIDKIEPILELYKGKLYCILIYNFINDCVMQFGKSIFSKKKSYIRTLTNILSTWILSLYVNSKPCDDYFFPSSYDNTTMLKDILEDYCKYDETIENINKKINIIICNIKKKYNNILLLLENYKKSLNYNKYNYNIMKNQVHINNNILYKYEITTRIIIKENKLKKILKNLYIPLNIYNKLINRYSGDINKIDIYIWCLIYRYQLLSSNNNQLALLPNILKEMNNNYNLNFECFASAINSYFPNYCSIYYDIEKYFGSIGNFFNIVPVQGTFSVNPPYQKVIINLCINKILNCLDNTVSNLTFIITIPIWDIKGKQIMKYIYNNELEVQNINYGEFEIINTIITSKYCKSYRMISKNQFTYIDYNYEIFKNKTIQNTYIIILSNIDNIDVTNFNNYNFEK
jgi:hypothetical protein